MVLSERKASCIYILSNIFPDFFSLPLAYSIFLVCQYDRCLGNLPLITESSEANKKYICHANDYYYFFWVALILNHLFCKTHGRNCALFSIIHPAKCCSAKRLIILLFILRLALVIWALFILFFIESLLGQRAKYLRIILSYFPLTFYWFLKCFLPQIKHGRNNTVLPYWSSKGVSVF